MHLFKNIYDRFILVSTVKNIQHFVKTYISEENIDTNEFPSFTRNLASDEAKLERGLEN